MNQNSSIPDFLDDKTDFVLAMQNIGHQEHELIRKGAMLHFQQFLNELEAFKNQGWKQSSFHVYLLKENALNLKEYYMDFKAPKIDIGMHGLAKLSEDEEKDRQGYKIVDRWFYRQPLKYFDYFEDWLQEPLDLNNLDKARERCMGEELFYAFKKQKLAESIPESIHPLHVKPRV